MSNKFLNSQEYNSLVKTICNSTDYIIDPKKFDLIFDKLFTITEDDLLQQELINKPLTKIEN